MGKAGFYPKLALVNLARNGQFYLPYLLTVAGTAAAYYIAVALAGASDLPLMTRYAYLSMFMTIGTVVIALFAVIFLTYTNGFLMKRRKKELGLYNILGLGKGNIALVLAMETLYTAAAGVGGGMVLGLLLQKLVTLLLYKIMHFDAYFGFYVSGKGILSTVVLFGAILLGNLLLNLVRIQVRSPMELLREGSEGEREPKTKHVTAALGVVCLGGGYALAVTTKSALSALAVYFIAVILVILGTYFLFSAVSIVVLKGLRNNRRYYYQTNHFIGVSGMLYRMKRNAVGLANICILSTMVLVMVSGTLSLYIGSQNALEAQFPGNVGVSVEYDPTAEEPFDANAMAEEIGRRLTEQGVSSKTVYTYRWLGLYAETDGGAFTVSPSGSGTSVRLCFLTEEDYAAMGRETAGAPEALTLRFPNGVEMPLEAVRLTDRLPALGGAFMNSIEPRWYVVQDRGTLESLYLAQRSALGEDGENMSWHGFWNADTTEDQELDLPGRLEEKLDFSGIGSWNTLHIESRGSFGQDYYSINGGFFFLGLFLGLLFIMATVLIIYYKQISEGYEDRERYLIMQKVGMEAQTVRRSVNSQILVVFFAPLLVAAVHIAFDYSLVVRLLTLFSLYDGTLTLWCTVGTFGVFCAVYALVYRATARIYYKLVRAE